MPRADCPWESGDRVASVAAVMLRDHLDRHLAAREQESRPWPPTPRLAELATHRDPLRDPYNDQLAEHDEDAATTMSVKVSRGIPFLATR